MKMEISQFEHLYLVLGSSAGLLLTFLSIIKICKDIFNGPKVSLSNINCIAFESGPQQITKSGSEQIFYHVDYELSVDFINTGSPTDIQSAKLALFMTNKRNPALTLKGQFMMNVDLKLNRRLDTNQTKSFGIRFSHDYNDISYKEAKCEVTFIFVKHKSIIKNLMVDYKQS